MTELFKGKEASQIGLIGEFLLVRKVMVPVKNKYDGIIIPDSAKEQVYHLSDFECHPYLAEIVVLSKEVQNDKLFLAKPGDIVIVSRTLPERIIRGLVEGILIDGVELTRVTKNDVIAVVPYLKEKVKDGEVKSSVNIIGVERRSIN